MQDDKETEDRLLEYFKTVPNKKLIINLYLSYMAAIEFIMHMELDREYVEFSEMQKQKTADPMEEYLRHIEQNTDWNKTDN